MNGNSTLMVAEESQMCGDSRGAIFIDPTAYVDQQAWHAVAAELRESTPVLRVEADGYSPFWAVTRYEDVWNVSRQNARFLNTRNPVLGPDVQFEMLGTFGIEPQTLIHMDGLEHRSHRAIADAWFRPRAVSRHQSDIDSIASQFVAKFRSMGGCCDFAQEVAVPFTLRVVMSIFGVPEEDERTMLRLTQGLFGAADPEYLGDFSDPFTMVTEAIGEFEEYFVALAEDRREHPADDLATVIANGVVGGCPIDAQATMWYFIIVATAGHDTTSFALSGGLEALLHHPEQVRKLQDDPELVGNAAEEMIRWTSPVRHFLRYATESVELSGTEISAGDRLLLSYPSANRDEHVFQDAMAFNVTRPNANRMIGFGAGDHFCLGSGFARREIRSILPRLLAEVSEISLNGEPEFAQANFVGGVKHLPVKARLR